jgi:hypothetical protein
VNFDEWFYRMLSLLYLVDFKYVYTLHHYTLTVVVFMKRIFQIMLVILVVGYFFFTNNVTYNQMSSNCSIIDVGESKLNHCVNETKGLFKRSKEIVLSLNSQLGGPHQLLLDTDEPVFYKVEKNTLLVVSDESFTFPSRFNAVLNISHRQLMAEDWKNFKRNSFTWGFDDFNK